MQHTGTKQGDSNDKLNKEDIYNNIQEQFTNLEEEKAENNLQIQGLADQNSINSELSQGSNKFYIVETLITKGNVFPVTLKYILLIFFFAFVIFLGFSITLQVRS